MGHVVRHLPWCVIDIDTARGHILFQERWRYHWIAKSPQRAWTYNEQLAFHTRVDRAIWYGWSNRVRFDVLGGSDFVKRFSAPGVTVNLDVRWVTAGEHWNVDVTKLAPGAFAQSETIWPTRRLILDTNDLAPRLLQQIPVVHEFGHTAGSVSELGRGDEYRASSSHNADSSSMMHTGNKIRNRHFDTLVEELNAMIADTKFSVRSIR